MRRDYRPDCRPPWQSTAGTVLVACQIAHRYTHRMPTVDELRGEFGMSRATAYRWLSAMKQAQKAA